MSKQTQLDTNRSNQPLPLETMAEHIDGAEALQDLAQLEELHQEAERMKALGNKHMAAQVSNQNTYEY